MAFLEKDCKKKLRDLERNLIYITLFQIKVLITFFSLSIYDYNSLVIKNLYIK